VRFGSLREAQPPHEHGAQCEGPGEHGAPKRTTPGTVLNALHGLFSSFPSVSRGEAPLRHSEVPISDRGS
jgi:hypothetical protein